MRASNDVPEGYITAREYALQEGYQPRSVQRAIQNGRLDAVVVKGKLYVDAEANIGLPGDVKCEWTTCKGNRRGICVWLTECLVETKGECSFYRAKKK